MSSLSERLLLSYRQGGAAGVARRASLYAQRIALSKAAPWLERAGKSRSNLVRYIASIDRRQESEDTEHVATLIDLAERGPVVAAVPAYIKPFVNAVRSFGKHATATLRLDDAAARNEATALMLPFSLVHGVDTDFLRVVLDRWHIACANHHAVTFSKEPTVICSSEARQMLRGQLAKLDMVVQHGGYPTPGGYRLKCRRNGYEVSMIEEVWNDYFGWGLTFAEDDAVMDIGANIGAFTVEASRRVPYGRVVAFEPEPGNFDLLRENVEAHGRGNVILRQEAVSDRAGTATLSIDSEHTGAHSIVSPKAPGTAKITVPVVAFADAAAQLGHAIGVLKIDCEGAEYDVLFPARDLLKQRVRQIVAEVQQTDRYLPADLVTFLQGIGFAVEYRGSKNLGLIKATNPAFTS